MNKIVLSTLIAVLGFSLQVKAMSGLAALEQRKAQEERRDRAKEAQQKDGSHSSQPDLVELSGYQHFGDEFDSSAVPNEDSKKDIVDYIKDHCKGGIGGLRGHFRSLAKAIKKHQTPEISRYLEKISAFREKEEWKSIPIAAVRHTVLEYFNRQKDVYGAISTFAREALAD